MKLFACLFAILILSVGLAHGQGTATDLAKFESWTTFTSPEGDFTIRFPGKTETSQTPYNQNFSYVLRNSVVADVGPERRISIDYVDFKGQLRLLEDFQDRGLSNVSDTLIRQGATLVSKGDITHNNCPGKEAVLRAVNPTTKVSSLVKLRTFSSGTVVYFLFYGGGADDAREQTIANNFLSSFTVIGGCQRAVASAGGPSGLVTVEGTLDPATQWQRINSPYGVSFLLPGPGKLQVEELPPSPTLKFYRYAYPGRGHLFAVEIYDGFKPELRSNPAQMNDALERVVAGTKLDYEGDRYRFGECRTVHLGTLTGRECDLTVPGSEFNGRIQFFVTRSRSFVLIGGRGTASADVEPLNRFFSSVRIEP